MPVQSREQLKNYFRNGNLAREEYFADLIDSTVNKVNDNLDTDAGTGLVLTPSLLGKRFISFFKDAVSRSQDVPSFVLQSVEAANSSGDSLSMTIPGTKNDRKDFVVFKTATTRTGAVQGKVGINTSNPVSDLEVNGSIGMKTRIGRYSDPAVDPKQVMADGKWHTLLTNLKGFNSFEVLSVAYSPDGKYAMQYSLLMNAFSRSKRVTPVQQVYRRWWHRIQLRWVPGTNGTYGVEIRTASDYKNQRLIYYQITKLWN
jgi:hypothetical protein